MRVAGSIVVGAAIGAIAGCGMVVTTDYPNRLIGAEGQRIVMEDVDAVVQNPSLTDDEKRSQLRDLGLEDERLIDALLSL